MSSLHRLGIGGVHFIVFALVAADLSSIQAGHNPLHIEMEPIVSDPEAIDIAKAYILPEYKSELPSYPMGAVTLANIRSGRADVNDDGIKELFIEVDHAAVCGTAGCPIEIFQKKRGKWRSICGYMGMAVWMRAEKDGGYHQIEARMRLDGAIDIARWKHGACYVPANPAESG